MNKLLPALASAVFLLGCAGNAKDRPAEQPETAKAAEPQNCLQATGSHIKRSEDRPCLAGPGEVYTRDDIDRTGATTTAEALRRLSPTVR